MPRFRLGIVHCRSTRMGHPVMETHMPNAERTLGIVPLVFADDGGGFAMPAKCCLCGERIVQHDLCYGRLATDPPDFTRPLHVNCRAEFELFMRALGH